MNRKSKAVKKVPLCVDLDGTLVKTDLLVESIFALLKQDLLFAFFIPFWLMRGRSYLKDQVARRITIDVSLLPYHESFLDYLKTERKNGRRVILVTASHNNYAHAIANHLKVFEDVMASDDGNNLAGKKKLDRLIQKFGKHGFDYAGNSRVDLPIFHEARKSVLVNPEFGVETRARGIAKIERVFETDHGSLHAYIRAIRPHQWLKNFLVFVPLIAAHEVGNTELIWRSFLAFISFCLCASSVYLLNDLADLASDRAHLRKRHRPFASGSVSIKHGVILIPLLLIAAFAVSLLLPPAFMGTLILYYAITLGYSFWLKRKLMVDVIVLTGLYTVRVLAGSAATAIVPSFWILAFSMYLFLSLAMIKRYSELLDLSNTGKQQSDGRGYVVQDMATIQGLGAASGYISVLVLALYINSNDVRVLYSQPEVIWLLCPVLLYWVSRMWQRAGRGEMHDDPLVFAVKDRISRMLGLAVVIVLVAAS